VARTNRVGVALSIGSWGARSRDVGVSVLRRASRAADVRIGLPFRRDTLRDDSVAGLHHLHGRTPSLCGSALAAVESKLVIVSANDRVQEQLVVTGITATIGADNVYTGDERLGATLKRAHADAIAGIETRHRADGSGGH